MIRLHFLRTTLAPGLAAAALAFAAAAGAAGAAHADPVPAHTGLLNRFADTDA